MQADLDFAVTCALQQRISRTQLHFQLERKRKKPAKPTRSVFHISPLRNAATWGQIRSCYRGRWLHWLQLNSHVSKGCRAGWELCSP